MNLFLVNHDGILQNREHQLFFRLRVPLACDGLPICGGDRYIVHAISYRSPVLHLPSPFGPKILPAAKIFWHRFRSRTSQRLFTALLRSNETILKCVRALEIGRNLRYSSILGAPILATLSFATINDVLFESMHIGVLKNLRLAST